MIQLNSCLFSFDNSGVFLVRCIRVFNNRSKLGSFLIVSVKTTRYNNKVKLKINKGSVLIASLLKITLPSVNFSGLKLKSSINGVILLNKQYQPISSRVFGVITRKTKLGGLKKISLSGVVI